MSICADAITIFTSPRGDILMCRYLKEVFILSFCRRINGASKINDKKCIVIPSWLKTSVLFYVPSACCARHHVLRCGDAYTHNRNSQQNEIFWYIMGVHLLSKRLYVRCETLKLPPCYSDVATETRSHVQSLVFILLRSRFQEFGHRSFKKLVEQVSDRL